MSTFDDTYLKPSDLARQLALHRSQVYKLINDGTLPHIRIGRAVRVPAAAFQAYLRSLHQPLRETTAADREILQVPAEIASRLVDFEELTSRDPFVYVEAWKRGEIPDTPENADYAMDALALRTAIQAHALVGERHLA
jgi:excisionase family DNA binding protein